MRKSISTPVRKENFTENGVTPGHFVTKESCDQDAQFCRSAGLESITRRYQTEPAALTELVEVLYQLLLSQGPVSETANAEESMALDCGLLPGRTGVTNVSPALRRSLGEAR
jgi:hypothetical protein